MGINGKRGTFLRDLRDLMMISLPWTDQWRLKYWTARSWRSAAARLEKVPRFRRFPVRGSILRE
jgi:hypothetical protein